MKKLILVVLLSMLIFGCSYRASVLNPQGSSGIDPVNQANSIDGFTRLILDGEFATASVQFNQDDIVLDTSSLNSQGVSDLFDMFDKYCEKHGGTIWWRGGTRRAGTFGNKIVGNNLDCRMGSSGYKLFSIDTQPFGFRILNIMPTAKTMTINKEQKFSEHNKKVTETPNKYHAKIGDYQEAFLNVTDPRIINESGLKITSMRIRYQNTSRSAQTFDILVAPTIIDNNGYQYGATVTHGTGYGFYGLKKCDVNSDNKVVLNPNTPECYVLINMSVSGLNVDTINKLSQIVYNGQELPLKHISNFDELTDLQKKAILSTYK